MGQGEKGEGIKQRKKIHRHRQWYGDDEGKGVGQVEKGTEGDLTSAEHTIQYTSDVLQNCTPATYIIVLTSVTPINSI